MSDYDFPTFNDGRRAPRQPTLKAWNYPGAGSSTDLFWLEDDIKVSGYAVSHMVESTGEKLGGFAGASERAGTILSQLDDATQYDKFLPGHVLSLLKGAITSWYLINEVSPPFKGKEIVRVNFGVSRIINPFFSGLLSTAEGDTHRQTFSKATVTGTTTATLTTTPVNTRTGATLTCALTALGTTTTYPGIAINATSGVITLTGATLAVGVYELDVTCTDVLANFRNLVGGNRLVLTITA